MIKCTDNEIARLLPWYFNETLLKPEHERVKSHLADCPHCAKDIEDMKWISNQVETRNIVQHIDPAQLVLYAESKNELARHELLTIEEHLQSCSECNSELQILERVNHSLETTPKGKLLDRIKQKWREIVPEFIPQPVLAYIIIVLLIYPAWLGILELNRNYSDKQEPMIAQANYQLSQFTTRTGAIEENEINISPQTEVFSLSLNVPILSEENIRYNATIFDVKKNKVWAKNNIKSLDDYGTFLLVCYSQFFTDRNYILIIEEFNSTENKVQDVFEFPFNMKQSEIH